LQQAKSRRLAALKNCQSDRLLVEPADHVSELRMPEQGTVAAFIIDALGHGFTIAQFEVETGWSKARIMANLYTVAKKTGVGVQRRNQSLFAIWPADDSDAHTTAATIDGPAVLEVEYLRTA
jgi:hypothetical protein